MSDVGHFAVMILLTSVMVFALGLMVELLGPATDHLDRWFMALPEWLKFPLGMTAIITGMMLFIGVLVGFIALIASAAP